MNRRFYNKILKRVLTTGGDSTPPAPSYILEENFEEIDSGGALGSSTDGYDSPYVTAEYLGTGGTALVSPNSTAYSLQGSKHLLVQTNTTDATAYAEFTLPSNLNSYWIYMKIRGRNLGGNINRDYIKFFNTAGTQIGSIGATSGGTTLNLGGVTGQPPTFAPAETICHFWIKYSGGIAGLYYSTDGIRPTAGNQIVEFSTTPANGFGRIQIGWYNRGDSYMAIDRLLVSETEIGNNP